MRKLFALGDVGPDGVDVRLRVVFAVPRRTGPPISGLRTVVRAGLCHAVYARLCADGRTGGRCPSCCSRRSA